MEYGLIGEKIGHSFSPQIHAMLASYEYSLYPISREALGTFLHERNFRGLNVTIPYKKSVMPFCDYVDHGASEIGSVNTLVVKSGKLLGYNTDIYGFLYMVKRSGITFKEKKVLVLGSGGTSMTAVFAAKSMGAKQVVVISRNGENNYSSIALHSDTEIIVNTTPVGMYPGCGTSPLDLSIFNCLSGVIDVIYNPLKTALLIQAEKMGLSFTGGLPMLVAQAKMSAELFTGEIIPDNKIEDIILNLSHSMSNIVLVGMPGSGKSAVGMRLAERLGKRFVDMDAEIVAKTGIFIPEIFSVHGEAFFRKIESEVIAELGKNMDCVIATGGGSVLKNENYLSLRQNGFVLYLTRALNKLPKSGRPLSQITDLAEMERARRPRYEMFSNAVIDNDGDISDTVQKAIEVFYENICY